MGNLRLGWYGIVFFGDFGLVANVETFLFRYVIRSGKVGVLPLWCFVLSTPMIIIIISINIVITIIIMYPHSLVSLYHAQYRNHYRQYCKPQM